MDESKKDLYGSESRDIFRWWHKHACPKGWYGLDIDFVIIDNKGILAFIDYKKSTDSITWAEKIAYEDLKSHGYKVYIAQENGNAQLYVYEYLGDGTVAEDGERYIAWESRMRENNNT